MTAGNATVVCISKGLGICARGLALDLFLGKFSSRSTMTNAADGLRSEVHRWHSQLGSISSMINIYGILYAYGAVALNLNLSIPHQQHVTPAKKRCCETQIWQQAVCVYAYRKGGAIHVVSSMGSSQAYPNSLCKVCVFSRYGSKQDAV